MKALEIGQLVWLKCGYKCVKAPVSAIGYAAEASKGPTWYSINKHKYSARTGKCVDKGFHSCIDEVLDGWPNEQTSKFATLFDTNAKANKARTVLIKFRRNSVSGDDVLDLYYDLMPQAMLPEEIDEVDIDAIAAEWNLS